MTHIVHDSTHQPPVPQELRHWIFSAASIVHRTTSRTSVSTLGGHRVRLLM
jgi:CRISPR/Cas system-associated exonuclease Cas4 (RecB family)